MQGSTCSPWSRQNHAGAGGCLRGGCDLMGRPHWSRNLQTCGKRSPCCSRFPGRTCDTVGDPHWSSLPLQDCTPWQSDLQQFRDDPLPMGWTHVGEVHGELSPIGGPHMLQQGKDSSLRAGTTCEELSITSIPCLCVPLGEEVELFFYLRCHFITQIWNGSKITGT